MYTTQNFYASAEMTESGKVVFRVQEISLPLIHDQNPVWVSSRPELGDLTMRFTYSRHQKDVPTLVEAHYKENPIEGLYVKNRFGELVVRHISEGGFTRSEFQTKAEANRFAKIFDDVLRQVFHFMVEVDVRQTHPTKEWVEKWNRRNAK